MKAAQKIANFMHQATKYSYINGMLTMLFLMSMWQDFFGLEWITNNWIDLPWVIWFIPLGFVWYRQHRLFMGIEALGEDDSDKQD